MRFRCESCGAQYAIADEKLGKKGVRVRCKKCSEIITVLPPEAQEEQRDAVPTDPDADLGHDPQAEAGERENTEVDSAPGGSADGPSEPEADGGGDGFDLGADDELKSALDNILGDEDEGLGDDLGDDEEEDDADLDRQSTRVFTVEEMQQVQAEREQAGREDEEVGGPTDSLAGGPEPDAADSQAAGDEDRERVEWYAAVDDQQVGPMSLNEFAERWRTGEFDSETLVWKTGFDDWRSVFELAEFSFLAEEEEPAGDDWASQRAEPEDDWSRGVGQDEDETSDDDDDLAGLGGFDDEDDEPDGSDDYFDEDEAASSAASATAFAADVEWQPSALSSLNSLAEEELAELAPEDPEPEEEELPFDPEEGLPTPDDTGLGEDEMEDGDSSLIAQIAAEEEAAAKQAEVERAAKEKQAEELRRKEEESALAAQEAAAREKLEEQRERAAPPEEKYIPPRSSLPKWAIGLMVGGGLMMLALVGTLGYLLAKGDEPVEPNGTQAIQPTGPAKPAGPAAPADGPAPTKPTGPAADQPGADQAAVEGAPGKPGDQPAKPEVAKAGTGPAAAPKDEPTPVAKPADVQKPKPKPKPDRTPRRKRRKRKVDRKPDRVAVAPKVPDPVEDKPKARDEKPPRHKPKGGILDFEDPDDRAFAAETGVKPKPTAPKPEKKVLPPLSQADVLTVMKGHLAEFKACNRKQKQIDSSVRGKMVVNFTIANSGRVKSASISGKTSQFKGTYVAKCIQNIVKRLKFPEFGGPVKKVPFPFTVN